MCSKATGLLQTNINHARQAQDLFVHTLAERDCGLGVVVEPYRVPAGHPCWAANLTGFVAFTKTHTYTRINTIILRYAFKKERNYFLIIMRSI